MSLEKVYPLSTVQEAVMGVDVRSEIERFIFRNLHDNLFTGTASDRYAGWLGQIYSEE